MSEGIHPFIASGQAVVTERTSGIVEVTAAGWNAHKSFANKELDDTEFSNALEVVDGIGPVGVLVIPETGVTKVKSGESLPESRIQEIRDEMKKRGFTRSIITTGLRDDLYMSLWVNEEEVDVAEMGEMVIEEGRGVPYVDIEGFGRVFGVHNVSTKEEIRDGDAANIIKALKGMNAMGVGDFNTQHKGDKWGRFYRALDVVTRQISNRFEYPYFSENKFVWLGGVAIRTAAMARGNTMATYVEGGFSDADTGEKGFRPTAFMPIPLTPFKLAQRIDHIISTDGIETSGYEVMDQPLDKKGKPVSDHTVFRAIGRARQLKEELRSAA